MRRMAGGALAVLLAAVVALTAVTAAHGQTPEATVACEAIPPVALPGTGAIGAAAAGTPGPAASPVVVGALATPVADAAAAQLQADLERVVRTVAACQSTGRVKGLTQFVTPGFLGDFYAGGGRLTVDEFVAFAPALPRVRVNIQAVTAPTYDPRGFATAEVTSVIGRQLVRADWSFVFRPAGAGDETGADPSSGNWLADGVTPLQVDAPAGATTLQVRLTDNAYKPSKLSAAGPDVVLQAKNDGKDDHELLVLRLKKGTTTQALLAATGPELPAGVNWVGQLTVPAGESGTLVLVGLSKGTYAIVDLLVDQSGTPHLALGMEATLTVQEAS